jgi:hypothetical protein
LHVAFVQKTSLPGALQLDFKPRKNGNLILFFDKNRAMERFKTWLGQVPN